MGYLILGFLLGVAVSWFWQTQFSGVPAFKQLMQKELAVNGQLGSVNTLKKRLETLEARFSEMEAPTEFKNRSQQPETEHIEKTAGITGAVDRDQVPAETAKGVQKSNVVAPLRPPATKIDRNKVMSLWHEGKDIAEIASKLNLGKGEVKLIISMQDRFRQKQV